MSYAGTYGADGTCNHDCYWRSCPDCNAIGPRATQAQIDSYRRQRGLEIEATRQAELERQETFSRLNSDEKCVAEAFWAAFLDRYSGLSPVSLDNAVRGNNIDSWAVGHARSICKQAKLAVAALRSDSSE